MPRFQRKPFVIEAVQWHRPGDHPAVEAREPHILFDRAGHYFYVARFDDEMMKARAWLAVDPDGDVAQREGNVLPFAFYKVKEGEAKPIHEHRDLYERYAKQAGMLTEPVATGLVQGPGSKVSVKPGDWIIGEPEGTTFTVLNDEAFRSEYKPISD